MTTREKILEAARLLFNKKGVEKVSVRNICSKLNISLGNFSYHFPDKGKIVSDLFQRMTEEMHAVLASIPRDSMSIFFYLESHKQLFLIQEKYKFFYLNLFEILTHHEDIKRSYLDNSKAERKMAHELLDLYVEKGVLKKGIPRLQFERMINVGQILNNSWLVDAEILFKGNQKKKLNYYMRICCGLLEPYLTDNSLKEYKRYFDRLSDIAGNE